MSQTDENLSSNLPNMSLQEEKKPNFNEVPAQALDAIRMRLAQLTHSLKRIKDELMKSDVPQWYTLQSQLNVTVSQLMSVTSTLQHFQTTLESNVVYPLPNFPTTSHENLLTTLLRKKHIPEVDNWLTLARDVPGLDLSLIDEEDVKQSLEKDKEATKWALENLLEEFEKHDFGNSDNIDNASARIGAVSGYNRTQNPLDVDKILSFMYKGQKIDKPVPTAE